MNADTRQKKVELTLTGDEILQLYILLQRRPEGLYNLDRRVGAAYRELMNQEAHELNEKAEVES